jgi:alpha-glucosidase
LMRTHTAWDTKDQEPWSYGSEYTTINRSSIELRYKLLPYLYNAMHEASVSGIPPLRPLVFDYPDDGNFTFNATEFMCGEGLLVAPVLWPGVFTRSITLPEGVWYDYGTGKRFQGGKRVEVEAPVDKIPIFAKAGAVIPTQQVLQFSDQAPIDPLTFSIFLADSARYEYYEDDGRTFDYQKGVFAERTIRLARKDGQLLVTIGEVRGTYRYPDRSLVVQLVGLDQAPVVVKVAGEEVPKFSGLESRSKGWRYEPVSKMLLVKMPDVRTEIVISTE